jgi:hypothetical protein
LKVINLHQEKRNDQLAIDNNQQAQQIYSQFSPKMLGVSYVCKKMYIIRRCDDYLFYESFLSLKVSTQGSFEGWIRLW